MSALAHNLFARAPGGSDPPPLEDAANAWRVVADEVDALVHGKTLRVNLDLQAFATRAGGVLTSLLAHDELRVAFERIAAAGFFDPTLLERLGRYLPALWYVAHMQKDEATTTSQALPPELLEAASQRRQRMLKVARHHLDEHPEEKPRLEAIKHGNDRARLANDLVTLAGIYQRHRETLQSDRFYRHDDAPKAMSDSQTIRAGLGKVPHGPSWRERAEALFTLVSRDYQELRSTGHWLLRAKPEEARTRFPTMVERRPRRRPSAEDDDRVPANDPPVVPHNDTHPTPDPTPAATAKKSPTRRAHLRRTP